MTNLVCITNWCLYIFAIFFRFQYVYATESLQSHNAKATVRRHKHAVAVAVVDAALHLVGDVTPTEYQVMTCRTTMTRSDNCQSTPLSRRSSQLIADNNIYITVYCDHAYDSTFTALFQVDRLLAFVPYKIMNCIIYLLWGYAIWQHSKYTVNENTIQLYNMRLK